MERHCSEILGMDLYTYTKERDSFLEALRDFHQGRRTPYYRLPRIGGKEVDLYFLYRKVIEAGGWEKVNRDDGWEELLEYMSIPVSCTKGGEGLKYLYIRYLDVFEQVHHFGEDPDAKDPHEMLGCAKKQRSGPREQVSLRYHRNQHEVSHPQRTHYGLSTTFAQPRVYAKLERALLSGLPNEVDFAVNVCTLLSNEGKHTLRAERAELLVGLLLAHVGVFDDRVGSLRPLQEHSWSKHVKRDWKQFWTSTIEDPFIRHLLSSNWDDENFYTGSVCDNAKHFSVKASLGIGRNLGVCDVEGQRILQVAHIIRNMSFEENNMVAMAANLLVFKFLMLCIYSSWSSLSQLALDALGNIAIQMVLEPANTMRTQLILRCISSCVTSRDKFALVRGMEILGRLCQVVENEDVLSDTLTSDVYEAMCALLTIHDIQLIVYTLEALYHLSELGAATSNGIACVPNALDTLVDLATVEAQSYGPGSLIGIKVVEHVPAHLAQQQQQHQNTSMQPPPPVATPTSTPKTGAPSSSRTPASARSTSRHATQSSPAAALAPEKLAANWLHAFYEQNSEGSANIAQIYREYMQTCKKFAVQNVVPNVQFAACIRSVFPKLHGEKVPTSGSSFDVKYSGLRRRHRALPFSVNTGRQGSCRSMATDTPTSSRLTPSSAESPQDYPHIEQALSTPHSTRSGRTSSSRTPRPILPAPSPLVQQQQHPQRPPAASSPLNAPQTESSLVKTLLASKVNRHLQSQQPTDRVSKASVTFSTPPVLTQSPGIQTLNTTNTSSRKAPPPLMPASLSVQRGALTALPVFTPSASSPAVSTELPAAPVCVTQSHLAPARPPATYEIRQTPEEVVKTIAPMETDTAFVQRVSNSLDTINPTSTCETTNASEPDSEAVAIVANGADEQNKKPESPYMNGSSRVSSPSATPPLENKSTVDIAKEKQKQMVKFLSDCGKLPLNGLVNHVGNGDAPDRVDGQKTAVDGNGDGALVNGFGDSSNDGSDFPKCNGDVVVSESGTTKDTTVVMETSDSVSAVGEQPGMQVRNVTSLKPGQTTIRVVVPPGQPPPSMDQVRAQLQQHLQQQLQRGGGADQALETAVALSQSAQPVITIQACSQLQTPCVTTPVANAQPPPEPQPSPQQSAVATDISPGRKRPADASDDAADGIRQKKRRNSKGIESRRSLAAGQPGNEVEYMCEWQNCNRLFATAKAVNNHVFTTHFVVGATAYSCLWADCDGVSRQKYSFVQHIQERHVTEAALRSACQKRKQVSAPPPPRQEPTPPAPTSLPVTSSPPPVYPMNAAHQAIRRFANRGSVDDFQGVKEGPVTKHIRLTSALILRNVARFSEQGRSILRRHERHLAQVALSNVECSTAIGACLFDLQPPPPESTLQ